MHLFNSISQMVLDQVCVVRSQDDTKCLNQDVLFLGTGITVCTPNGYEYYEACVLACLIIHTQEQVKQYAHQMGMNIN